MSHEDTDTSAAAAPRLRTTPEDFQVEEVPAYLPSGEGPHTYLWIEKRLRTTEQVARSLARLSDVAPREVGYAGRKDKVAVTRQWFSVPAIEPERAQGFEGDGFHVLEARRHGNKLRTGHLKANRFELRVRGVSPVLRDAAQERAAAIASDGLANAFGEQRFGMDGENAERGRALLGGHVPRDRRTARLMLSALQSEVFNRVLAERPLPLRDVECGDVAFIHETGGRYLVDDLERDGERARRFEVSPTGPIFGIKTLQPAGAVADRENRVMRDLDIPQPEDWKLARGLKLPGTRRPLRVPVAGLALSEEEADCLRLECELPAGSYVTQLVAALFGDTETAPPVGASKGSEGHSADSSLRK